MITPRQAFARMQGHGVRRAAAGSGDAGGAAGPASPDPVGAEGGARRAEARGPRPAPQETAFDHRSSLIGWMSLVGAAPTAVLVGLLVLGSGMVVAGAGAAAAGILAVTVLAVMAFGGDASLSMRQRALRAVTAGGMSAAWGTWNLCLGLVPLIFALTEGGGVVTAVLGGILTGAGAVLAVVGSMQRALARRRAGLPAEDPQVPIGMVP